MKEHPDGDSSSFDSLMREAAEALDVSPSTALDGGVPGKRGLDSHRISLVEGTVIGGRYRLVERLGQGGMGEVWAASHTITRRQVAIKFLRGTLSTRADLRSRFLREARAASLVRHPCVVEVLDVFELEDGLPVMVMELLVGETLGKRLARDRALSEATTVELILPVVEGVEAAHAHGIVHRDLKPDNIFLKQGDAGGVEVKVLDFGIAKMTAKEGDAAETDSLTGTGSILGTPWYMAPEQLCSEKDIDTRADIWALGVILYQCLAGRRPLDGSSIGQLVKEMHSGAIVPIEERAPGLDPALARLVGRMLARERADRQSDLVAVRELLARLAGRASSTPAVALNVPENEAIVLFSGRARAAIGMAFVLAGGVGWFLHSSSRLKSETEGSPPTNAAPLVSQSAATAVAPPVAPSAAAVSEVVGIPATLAPAMAAASSRKIRSAAPPRGTTTHAAEKEPPSVASTVPPPDPPPRRKGGLFDEVPF